MNNKTIDITYKKEKYKQEKLQKGKTYAISDIHGQYDKFIGLLEKINFTDIDTLYILGDVLDRGLHPIKTIMKLMEMPNCICICGNHEMMALKCLEFLTKNVEDISLDEIDEKMLDNLLTWQYNGSKTTIEEFKALDKVSRKKVLEFIGNFSVYEELFINDKKYILAHTFGNFVQGKNIEEHSLYDITWACTDYDIMYYNDTYVVTGHTPTQTIKNNKNPGYIYKNNNHIAIDCGASYPDGRLAAICLDTGEEFYS